MRLLQGCSQKALTTLYNRYSRQLVRYFFRMLWKDENKAQDFLQDLFVRIIERPQLFDVDRKFSTWIYSVAHNMCKNEYRKQGFRASVEKMIITDHVIESPAADDMDKESFMKVLERAMQVWSEEDRTLFVLRQEMEMNFSEIGKVLDCPESTARSRWFYLRKHLAENFREYQVILKAI